MFQIGFSDRRFALFAAVLDVSTKGLPPGLLLSLSATVCFGFVTIPVRRGPEHALPAAAVVVLERYHSRCSLLRAVGAVVVLSAFFRRNAVSSEYRHGVLEQLSTVMACLSS